MKKTILVLIPILLLISGCQTSKPSLGTSSRKSTDFSLEQMGGGKITLSEQKGKVVLVDFWATWCGPCKSAIPYIINIYNTYKDQGLIVLGISLDQERSALDKFIKDQPIPYPILYGDAQVARAYDVQGIPTMVIFDKKGKIAFREVGFSEKNIDSLKTKVSQLLQQK